MAVIVGMPEPQMDVVPAAVPPEAPEQIIGLNLNTSPEAGLTVVFRVHPAVFTAPAVVADQLVVVVRML